MEPEHNGTFYSLLLITGLAFIAPVISSRIRRIAIPIVVLEIMAGVVIGRSGLDLVQPSAIEDFLAEFGFSFLMFLSGLEIDFSLLSFSSSGREGRSRLRSPLTLGLLVFGGTVGLALLGSLGLRQIGLIDNPFFMALILSTTSVGVVVPVLREKRLQTKHYGQLVLVSATIADFATLLLLSVAIAALSGGLTLDLLLVLVLAAAFAGAAQLGQFAGRAPWLKRMMEELAHATSQLRVRGVFAFMVAWVVLAQALGVEIILGAFLAGAVVSLLGGPEESRLREKLDAIGYGFFVPIFFIVVGVEFNLQAIIDSPEGLLLIPLLLGLAMLVKILPSLILRLAVSLRESLAAGLLLSARLSLIIAASAIALDLGVIDEAINAAIILVAILTVLTAPVLFNRLLPEVHRERREGIIVVGTGQIAELLIRRLQASDDPFIVIGQDKRRVEDLRRTGVTVVVGPPDSERILARAGATRAESLVVLLEEAEVVGRVAMLARNQFQIPTVVAHVHDLDQVRALQQQGVKTVQPTLATAVALEGALRFPTALDVLIHEAEDVEVGETVLGNGSVAALPVRDLRLPGDALILSIQRDGQVMVPQGETVLRIGDRLALVGSPESVDRAVSLLEG